MCGIYLKTNCPSEISYDYISEHIGWRGEDNIGLERIKNAVVGHSRLSILDLSSAGNQPFKGEKGYLTFNGEIYNYNELATRYLPEATFSSTSDTEVLLKLIENGFSDWSKIRGMYAFAYTDGETTIFGRDPFGKKPLFFFQSGESLEVSSSISVFKSLNVSADSLAQFASVGYSYEGDYLYEGVKNCEAGRVYQFSKGQFKVVFDYWSDFRFGNDTFIDSDFKNVLLRAVKRRLIADVKIGLALSSGIDSTVLATLIAGLKEEITCFTVSNKNEGEIAKQTALSLGLNHRLLENADVTLMSFHNSFHEPFADSAVVNVLNLGLAAKNDRIKVVLTGDGADEMFLGYSHYMYFKWLDKLWFILPFMRSWIYKLSLKLLGKIYCAYWSKSNEILRSVESMKNLQKLNPIKLASIVGIRLWVENCSNRKVDIGSMLSQVEFRTPFLDIDVLEYVMSTDLTWRSLGKVRLNSLLPNWYEKPSNKLGFSSSERENIIDSNEGDQFRYLYYKIFEKKLDALESLEHPKIGRRYRAHVVGRWLKKYL